MAARRRGDGPTNPPELGSVIAPSSANQIRIPPWQYIHILDTNTTITRIEVGPKTYVKQDHEKITCGPAPMVRLPPRTYCKISDPAVFDAQGRPTLDENGQVLLRHGDFEYRLSENHPDPFPLYPGEQLEGKIEKLQVVVMTEALRLRATRDFTSPEGASVRAGDEWLFKGPGTYIPRPEVQVVETIASRIIKPNQALRIRARRGCRDVEGNTRRAGEEWLIRQQGAYLPGVEEEVVDLVKAVVLTDVKALHLKAVKTYKDVYGTVRKAGQEWLVTNADASAHLPDVFEQIVGEVQRTTLTNRQYCVVHDPVNARDGKQRFGDMELRQGPASFFLKPGEYLKAGIQDVYVLTKEEALLVSALKTYTDPETKESRKPGDRWMIYGPRDYIPNVEVEIIEKRRTIPLDENEGIYVRDTKTGQVRAVCGKTYMLAAHEELWEKDVPDVVEELLTRQAMGDMFVAAESQADGSMSYVFKDTARIRDRTRVVTCRVPHNAAVQVYDYKQKKSRVCFGPDLVALGPDEQFTVISLSGGKPKVPNMIKTLALMLGPDFMTDILEVETLDHARLSLTLSYSWHFDLTMDPENPQKIFSVRDFTGDACKAIASKVRTSVAQETFEHFHKNSARIIRASVLGMDGGKIKDKYVFEMNNLVITSIDIQSVGPIDQKTNEMLQKSVQLAIEITTKSQEATARQEAERNEQTARGRIERQKIKDEADAEGIRKRLLQLQAESAAVETSGQATAEARARGEAARIDGESEVKCADMQAAATKVETATEVKTTDEARAAEINHERALNELEVRKAKALAEIEAAKFEQLVAAIGRETMVAIAQAGPELQKKLLAGLGLHATMLSPLSLMKAGNAGGVGDGDF